MTQDQLDLDLPETPSPRRKSPRIEGVRRSIQGMVDLALERKYAADIGDLLDQVAALRQHRLFNALLAVLQRPHAALLLQPHEWKARYGRVIQPNEQPIVLLLPFGPVLFCFDVSQTEETEQSRPLPPELLNPHAMAYVQAADKALDWLTSNACFDGVRVSSSRHGLRSAGCIQLAEKGLSALAAPSGGKGNPVRVPIRFEVLLNSSYTPTERLATLAHELGHLYCGHLGATTKDWWPTRNRVDTPTAEFEAESVARLAFRRLAPDVDLPPHLHQYFAENDPLPTDGWDLVVAAADRVVDMSQGYSPRRR